MSVLLLIPARKGSTRVRNKNLRKLFGVPLMAHTLQAALDSGAGRVIISTDDPEIAAVARDYKAEAPFLRPPEYATDSAATMGVIRHALLWLEENERWRPDMVALLPPTNPFRTATTIRATTDLLAHSSPDVNSAITVTAPHTHPYRLLEADGDGRLRYADFNTRELTNTQDWPRYWAGSPAVRVSRAEFLLSRPMSAWHFDRRNLLAYEISSLEAHDIDTEEDFLLAEAIGHILVERGRWAPARERKVTQARG
ncbi:MAG: acylneuraminate cytidylyltransferase family protein [Deltaproteobacteria bacterium]|nr:acylneuraminate cytidylyltransferase family protein [Deltaproteobacteria bacterium]